MTATIYNDTDNEVENESSPLLPSNPSHSRYRPTSSPSIIHQTYSPKIVISIVFTIVFVISFGGNLMTIPAMRVYEDIICHHYYDRIQGGGHLGVLGDIDEAMCKGDEVQKELNIIIAVGQVLGAVPSLVTTIPYGLLADRIGRKPVFVMSVVGLVAAVCWDLIVMFFWRTIPLRVIWADVLFTFFGGGQIVTSMMFYAIASDISTEANRSNMFLLGICADLSGELIGPAIASTLMDKSPWIPLILGIVTILLGTSLVVFIPETLHLRVRANTSSTLTPDSASDRSVASTKTDNSNFFTAMKSQAADGLNQLWGAMAVLHSPPILLLLIAFIAQPFGSQSVTLCVRYVSKRFDWTLSKAGFLLSLRAFINILLLLIIIPVFSHVLVKRLHLSSKAKDLILARVSVIILIIGALLIAASPTIGLTIIGLIVWTLGTGYVALTRSVITTLVDQQHVARLYAAIAIVETAGALAAGPTLAALYTWGLKWKGPWIGLPFYCLAIITFISGIGVWTFSCLEGRKGGIALGDEDDRIGEEEREILVSEAVGLEAEFGGFRLEM